MTAPPPEDCPPPWVALPHLAPNDPCTQGAEEAYIDLEFLPFWKSLSGDEKAAWFDRWHASPEWREAITERYDWDPAEMARDAIEAEAWAKAHPLPPRRRWWQFWR